MRPIRWGVGAMGAVLVLAGSAAAQMGGPAPVYVEAAEQRAVRRSAELVGTAEARRQSVLGAETAGRVEKMLADAGDFVKAGGPICRLRTRPTELQLQRTEAQRAGAQAALRKMEAGFRREEIDQAEARVKAAKAGLDRWKAEFERTRKLIADGASTQAEMETVAAAHRQATEQLAEAEAYQALVRTGNRPEDIDAARAQVAAQTAAVEELKDTLAKMTVAMPFDGFVIRKMTEEGQWVNPGSPVAEVADLAVVRVQLDVPERHLAGLVKGSKAPVIFEALGDREFAGEISQIVPASAEGTHTVTVRVDVPNTMDSGRPAIAAGLFARVWLPVGEEHQALLVPKAAVIRQLGRDVVYTVSDTPPANGAGRDAPEAGKAGGGAAAKAGAGGAAALLPAKPIRFAVAVPVRIIQGYGRFMEVESEGLKAGTPVVTRGTYLLATGTPVQEYPKEKVPAGPAAPASGPGAKAGSDSSAGAKAAGRGE